MILDALMKKGWRATPATTILATLATGERVDSGSVATIATVAVTNNQTVLNEAGENINAAIEPTPEAANSDSVADDDNPQRAWITKEIRDSAGRLQAVKIGSESLQDHLYVVFDPEFILPEPLTVYSVDEIKAMADKSPAQVYEYKR